jgi:hypothetical protein
MPRLRFETITCDTCPAKWEHYPFPGVQFYVLPNGGTVHRAYTTDKGWCPSCKAVRTIERIPKRNEVLGRQGLLELTKKNLQNHAVLGLAFTLGKEDRARIEELNREIARMLNLAELARLRSAPFTICHTCSSISAIPWEELPKSGAAPVHPGCGGQLKVKEGRTDSNYSFGEEFFDVDGNKVREPT